MKICIFADCQSIFISQLVKNIKKKNSDIIIDGIQESNNYDVNFENYFNNLLCLNEKAQSKFILINKLNKYVVYKSKLKKIKKYDILNIHFITHIHILFWKDIRKISNTIIISFWGSDFHRISNKKRDKLKKILMEVSSITFTSDGMAEEFKTYYNNSIISQKISVCRFGIESLDSISKIEKKQENIFKKRYEIPNTKVIVAVGYSAVEARRHIYIMDVLVKLDQNILEKCYFIFQMNYGNLEYKNKVKSYLNELNIKYIFLENHMSFKELSELRVATDIMINLPDADQFSASMQEIMYAKNLVITGKWLPYQLLWNRGIFALILNDLKELSDVFTYAIENIEELKEKCKDNSDKIYGISSWEVTTPQWLSLYSSFVK